MNLAVRQVLSRQTFRLCSRFPYKNLAPDLAVTSSCSVVQFRKYCDNRSMEARKLPPLMEFPPVVWPSFINYIKNWMFANFIIRPYFDHEFNLHEFIDASKHAVEVHKQFKDQEQVPWYHFSCVVSDALQRSDFKSLEGLVEKDAITALKAAVSQLSVSQRQMLYIEKDDIFYSFPYQVGVMFDEADKRWVEITMCYHVLKGLKKMKDTDELPPISLGVNPEFQDKIFILNYRFIREFTKGVEDSWWVNIVNHFHPQSLKK